MTFWESQAGMFTVVAIVVTGILVVGVVGGIMAGNYIIYGSVRKPKKQQAESITQRYGLADSAQPQWVVTTRTYGRAEMGDGSGWIRSQLPANESGEWPEVIE